MTLNFWETVVRLAIAVVCGGIIGIERGKKHRPAGFRTHMIVCVGAALTMILGEYLAVITADVWQTAGISTDVTRFGAQVINGIGFLGAGTIVHSDSNIKGLTTAATVWSVGCIGLVIGFGWYPLALLTTASVFSVLFVMDHMSKKIDRKSQAYHITLKMVSDSKLFFDVLEYLRGWEVSIDLAEATVEGEADNATIEFHVKGIERAQTLIDNLKRRDGINTIKFR